MGNLVALFHFPTTCRFFNTSKRKQLHKEVAEERYPFLSDIRDEQMRKPGEPDYDSKTLHIPAKCWATMTAYEKQYWQGCSFTL